MKLSQISYKCPKYPLVHYDFATKNNIGAPYGLLIPFLSGKLLCGAPLGLFFKATYLKQISLSS